MSVLGKGTFLAALWLITCSAHPPSLPLAPPRFSQPIFPQSPCSRQSQARNLLQGREARAGRQGWYLSHSKWSECWAAGGAPASAFLGWWIVGSRARSWWGQPVLLGVKAVTRSPSKASFTCPCHSSDTLGLTLREAHCAGNSLRTVCCTHGPEMLVLLLATTELSECAATSLPPLLGAGRTPPRKQLYRMVPRPGRPEDWLGSCSLKPTPFSRAEPLLSTPCYPRPGLLQGLRPGQLPTVLGSAGLHTWFPALGLPL